MQKNNNKLNTKVKKCPICNLDFETVVWKPAVACKICSKKLAQAKYMQSNKYKLSLLKYRSSSKYKNKYKAEHPATHKYKEVKNV